MEEPIPHALEYSPRRDAEPIGFRRVWWIEGFLGYLFLIILLSPIWIAVVFYFLAIYYG